jgi:hypothetical protein
MHRASKSSDLIVLGGQARQCLGLERLQRMKFGVFRAETMGWRYSAVAPPLTGIS